MSISGTQKPRAHRHPRGQPAWPGLGRSVSEHTGQSVRGLWVLQVFLCLSAVSPLLKGSQWYAYPLSTGTEYLWLPTTEGSSDICEPDTWLSVRRTPSSGSTGQCLLSLNKRGLTTQRTTWRAELMSLLSGYIFSPFPLDTCCRGQVTRCSQLP